MHKGMHWKAAAGIAVALILGGQGCPATAWQTKKGAGMEKKGNQNVVERTYSIRAENQTVLNGSVVIAEVNGIEATWIAIHAEDRGKPGPVIGYGLVAAGMQKNVSIEIDAAKATPVMFAMMHEDRGERGIYEFPEADAPVKVNDDIVMAKFTAALK